MRSIGGRDKLARAGMGIGQRKRGAVASRQCNRGLTLAASRSHTGGVHYDGTRLRWANRRMHTANVVIGEAVYDLHGACGPRVQRDFELVLLHAGACQLELDGRTHRLRSGVIYLFRPGHHEHFQFSGDTPTHHSFCSITPGFVPRDAARRLVAAPFQAPCSEVFLTLLATAGRLRLPRHPATRRLIDQLGLCLFAEFLSACAQAAEAPGEDPAVVRFLHHVEDHFGEETCLKTAHQAAGISRNALIYKVRAQTGQTPARHLWAFRVERGVAMLGKPGTRWPRLPTVAGSATRSISPGWSSSSAASPPRLSATAPGMSNRSGSFPASPAP